MNVLETITDTLSDTKDIVMDGLCDAKDALCDFLDEDTTVKRRTIAIIILIAALVGLIYGLIIAPKKKVVVEMCDCADDWDDEDWD